MLIVSGEIDYGASPRLRERIHDEIGAGRRHLVLDLSAVTFIDSMALGVLVGAVTRLHETGGSLRVVCALENDRVLRIFDIAGVASSIALHHSREEARSALARSQQGEASPWAGQTMTIAIPSGPCLPDDTSATAAARKYAHDAVTASDNQPDSARRSGVDEMA
ncbi:MAG TPA: STAS domain-containing protein [Solirubrobacteraceae bacterium]|nr:STAS domain-containing protein [Solirubrobacteraceae bacterium]